ncbi:dihydroorotase [Pedobacter flavus]|uniref:Dihydroorotase n=1 Tax=Pedobacter flavus TaxID=3113906 RepID=A0ABU7H3R2_9SPHI|nr:dihydroorotase [Pedobacter sp. VNH31]MEE1885941.1 dihydroorotase [Pedobacter sp. VNH31]
MNILLKGVIIADSESAFNLQKVDVRIEKGIYTEIGTLDLKSSDKEVISGGVLSPGFFDLNVVAGDPGIETKEDLVSLQAAASAGGFTGVALMPNSKPVVHNKSAVEYILNRTKEFQVEIQPIGAVSVNAEGKDLAELYDMFIAGAKAFSDGVNPIQDAGFMSRAIQYANGFGALIFSYPENREIAGKAMINESSNSVMLGMKGNPALAEELHISRDLFLAAYHNAPIHISTISTAGSVALIKKAKKEGVQVTCDVAAHHLLLTEEALSDFDSNYKVKPPLRGKADVKALIAGLKDGTIDAITSQHTPHEIEFKAVEFEVAAYGMIGLQTVLPILLKAGLSYELIAEKLGKSPRKILKLETSSINLDSKANFVLYQPDKKWLYDTSNNYSKSSNSPFLNQELTGKVIATYHQKQLKRYE